MFQINPNDAIKIKIQSTWFITDSLLCSLNFPSNSQEHIWAHNWKPVTLVSEELHAGSPRALSWRVLQLLSIHSKVINFHVLIVYQKAPTVGLAWPLLFPLLGCWAFSANWLRFDAINIWKMFCIWCSWILHPYLAVCGMSLFKLLYHP